MSAALGPKSHRQASPTPSTGASGSGDVAWDAYASAVAVYQESPTDAAALRLVQTYSVWIRRFSPADADVAIAELKRKLGLKGAG
jgi:hypothetical protein